MAIPSSSKVVIIGGGIIGCSTAYHLAHMGVEVALIERKKLTSGTTFHAAGLVGQLRTNANITQLLGYSIDLYNKKKKRWVGTSKKWTIVKKDIDSNHKKNLIYNQILNKINKLKQKQIYYFSIIKYLF